MIGIDVAFKNRPNNDGTVSSFTVSDCLVAQNGSPSTTKPQVIVHLPKASAERVEGAWFEYDGSTYHIIGTTAPNIEQNTPTRWNRYCIAEKIYGI